MSVKGGSTVYNIYIPMLGEQLEGYEAPQRALHINMSVALRLLADIKE